MKYAIKAVCIGMLLSVSTAVFAQLPAKEVDAVIKTYKKKPGFEYDSFGKMELKMIEPVMDLLNKREDMDDETRQFVEFMSIFVGATSVKSLDSENATPELRAEFFNKMAELLADSPVIPLEKPEGISTIFAAYGIAIDENTFSEVVYMDEAHGTFAYLKGAIPHETVIKLSKTEEMVELFLENKK